MQHKLLCDADGVLVNFYQGVLDLYEIKNAPKDKQLQWDMFLENNINEEMFWKSIDVDFWANLPKTEEADELVVLCEKLFGRENICILTAPGLGEAASKAIRGKQIWFEKNFPQFVDHQILFGKAKHFCASDKSILLDDNDKNIEKFREWGGLTCKMPRLWNTLWDVEVKGQSFEFVRDSLNAIVLLGRTQQPDWKYDANKG